MSSCVVVLGCTRRRRRPRIGAFQKTLLLDFFPNFCGRSRVQGGHLIDLSLAEMRQPADEVHQMPAALFARRRAGRPSWHACEPDAMFYHVKKLAVGHLLRRRQTHVGRRRKQSFAYLGVAAAVIGVARGAVIRKMFQPLALYRRSSRHGIRTVSVRRRNRPAPHRARESHFNTARRRLGAKPGAPHVGQGSGYREQNNDGDSDERAFHVIETLCVIKKPS